MRKQIQRIIKNEGGLAVDQHDKGGMTYKGIARNYWGQWSGWETIDEVLAAVYGDVKKANQILDKDIDLDDDVVMFYKRHYWDKVRGDEIGDAVGFQVCDCAVNCGVTTAIKMLQGCVGVKVDGIIGPNTINATLSKPDALTLIFAYNRARVKYYQSLRQYQRYGHGWLNRVKNNNNYALMDCQ